MTLSNQDNRLYCRDIDKSKQNIAMTLSNQDKILSCRVILLRHLSAQSIIYYTKMNYYTLQCPDATLS